MRLHAIALALLPFFSFVEKADALTNAPASSARLATSASTKDRADTLVSEPLNASDEERIDGITSFGKENKFASFLVKSMQALWKPDATSRLELQVAWWRLRKKTPRFVYDQLELDLVDKHILSHPCFQLWVEYVDRCNLKHPEKKVSIFATLWQQYNEYTLSMMLEQAKREVEPSLQAMGTKLQLEQMVFWQSSGNDTRQLYHILQSNPSHRRLLTGHVWDLNFSNFILGEFIPVFDQLMYAFGDVSLTSLIAAKQSEEAAALATDLQLQLERYREKVKTTETVNEILQSVFDKDAINIIREIAETQDGIRLKDKLVKLAAAQV